MCTNCRTYQVCPRFNKTTCDTITRVDKLSSAPLPSTSRLFVKPINKTTVFYRWNKRSKYKVVIIKSFYQWYIEIYAKMTWPQPILYRPRTPVGLSASNDWQVTTTVPSLRTTYSMGPSLWLDRGGLSFNQSKQLLYQRVQGKFRILASGNTACVHRIGFVLFSVKVRESLSARFKTVYLYSRKCFRNKTYS